MKKAIIGIDPGNEGALALMVDGAPVEYTRMPNTTKGVREWLEMAVRFAASCEVSPWMTVEYQQPMPQKFAVNIKGTANMMRSYGQWEVHALYLDIPYHEVTPQAWKKVMGVTSDKATSIQLCERLFPSIDLILPGCRKKHDGIAEAILLCEYTRRLNL